MILTLDATEVGPFQDWTPTGDPVADVSDASDASYIESVDSGLMSSFLFDPAAVPQKARISKVRLLARFRTHASSFTPGFHCGDGGGDSDTSNWTGPITRDVWTDTFKDYATHPISAQTWTGELISTTDFGAYMPSTPSDPCQCARLRLEVHYTLPATASDRGITPSGPLGLHL